MSQSLVLQGEFESATLPTLLRTLHHDRETGVISVVYEGVTRRMFLQKGQIVFATSSHPDDRLGEYLLRRGIINVEQYLESARLITPEKKQGAVLCELGHISAEELPDLVKNQVLSIILSMFQWTRGAYTIDLRESLDAADAVVFNFNTGDVIMRGIKQITSWQRIFSAVGPPATLLAKSKEADQASYRLTLNEEESHIISLVGEATPVSSVCAMSYLKNFETYRLLWGFLSVGMIEKAPEASMPHPEEDERIETLVGLYNKIFARIYETLFQGVGERAEDLMAQALKDVTPQYPELFNNVYIDASGRVDVNQFHQNLFISTTAQRHTLAMTALNELLYNLIFAVKREMGTAAEKQLAQQIGALKQRLMG